MPITEVEMPNGDILEVDAPEGTSDDQIFAFVRREYGAEYGLSPAAEEASSEPQAEVPAQTPVEDQTSAPVEPQEPGTFESLLNSIGIQFKPENIDEAFAEPDSAYRESVQDVRPPSDAGYIAGLAKTLGAPQKAFSQTLAEQVYGDGNVISPLDVLRGNSEEMSRYRSFTDALFENHVADANLAAETKGAIGATAEVIDQILLDPLNLATAGGARAVDVAAQGREGIERITKALDGIDNKAAKEQVIREASESSPETALTSLEERGFQLQTDPAAARRAKNYREGEVYPEKISRQYQLEAAKAGRPLIDSDIPSALQARARAAENVRSSIENGTSPKLVTESRSRATDLVAGGMDPDLAVARAIDESVAKRIPPAPVKTAPVTPELARAGALTRKLPRKQGLISKATQPIVDRISSINPYLGQRVRRVSQQVAEASTRDIKLVDSLYRKIPKGEVKKFDQLWRNGKITQVRELAEKYGAVGDLRAVQSRLDELARVRLGYDKSFHYVQGYAPRTVTNVSKLRQRLGRSESDFNKAAEIIKKRKGVSYLDVQDEAELIDQLSRGRVIYAGAGRTIKEVPDEVADLYDDGKNSLISYFHRENETNALREFTGGLSNKSPEEIPKDMSSTIGDAVASLREQGALTGQEGIDLTDDLVNLLKAYVVDGRMPPSEGVRLAKQWINVSTIGGNFGSTLAQITDAAIVATRMGIPNFVRAIFQRRGVAPSLYETGIRSIANDLRNPKGKLEKLERAALVYTGFNKLDKAFASIGSRASWIKFKRMSTNSPDKFRKMYDGVYTPDEMDQILKEFSGEAPVTGLSKAHVLSDISEIRPTGREDMPLFWAQHPNGRVAYSLLSWSLKQANTAKKLILGQLHGGNRLQGIASLALMSMGMSLAGVPREVFNSWLRGDEFDPTSAMAEGAFAYGLMMKNLIDGFKRGNTLEAIIPAAGVATSQVQGLFKSIREGDPSYTMKSVGPLRSLWYLFHDGEQFDLKKVGLLAVAGPALVGGAVDKVYQALPETPQEVEGKKTEDGFFEAMKEVENSVQAGRNKHGMWFPHKSLEGDTPTIGYGHKLTPEEVASGVFAEGLTDQQVEQLFKQDLAAAEQSVAAKVPEFSVFPKKYQDILTNLEFNTGNVSPRTWPRLLAAMAAGDDKEVRKQMVTSYYDPKKGERVQLTKRANRIADSVGLQ